MAKPLKGPSLIDEDGVVLHRDGDKPAKVVRLDKNGVNKGGRPVKFDNAEQLEKKINEYFDAPEKMNILTKKGEPVEIDRPFTLEGLALHLDCSTDTVRNYANTDTFFDIIERARQKILESWFAMGLTGQYSDRVLSMIVPANNPEYNIKQQVDVTAVTVEDKLRIIKEQREQRRIESAKQIECGGENGEKGE